MDEETNTPFRSPFVTEVCQVRELYEALVDVEFAENEALYLVASVLAGGPKAP